MLGFSSKIQRIARKIESEDGSEEERKIMHADTWKENSHGCDGYIKALANDRRFLSPSVTKNGKVLSLYDVEHSDGYSKNNKYLRKVVEKGWTDKNTVDKQRKLDFRFENLLKHDHVSALKQLNKTIDNNLNFLIKKL